MRKAPPAPEAQQGLPRQGFSLKAAAARLSISERFLWELIERGKIRAVRLSARRRCVSDLEIARVLTEGLD